ncbi:MAG: signal peptidase II [Eubacterium sp.]|nr:signal peptidase II [Eubacterium sp.]
MENNLKEKSNGRFYLLTIILLAVLIAVDHLTKHLAVVYLKDQPPIVLIKGTLELHYLENHGAAFGMLQNQQWLFAVLTVVFLVIAVWFFRKVPKTKKYLPLSVCVTFLVAGAIGNFIDRVVNKYVVDFIYFSGINFPIFNVADICVSLSVIVLVLLLLFKYKEGDMSFLKAKKEKQP